ncbi:hypothetical protein L1987_72978 [Smallanthus sonchifolius]|uniref:Uncharacterized protein n=1 Tax=Smallanthus sonchifolius TaxID=185202 RepID=A0ACB9AYD8_9ASTR|nr:hypothetical protein L1987_72978 [Smallanthus sonchifolius]
MQKGNNNQQQNNLTSDHEISEYSAATLLFNGAPYTSIGSITNGPNFNDIAKVLSEVELPPPSPALPTSCSIHNGQPSGAKKIEGNNVREKKLKDIHGNLQETGTQFVPHAGRDKKQKIRSKIHERIIALKALVPECNKSNSQRDQASILDDVIKHIKSLQMQMQMMQSMGVSTMTQGSLYMSPRSHQSMQEPSYLTPYLMMRSMNGAGCFTGHYGSYFTSISPVFSPFASCFDPLVPPMQVDTGSPRLLPIPHLAHIPKPVYTATLSSDVNTVTDSQVGFARISSQDPYHMPVTTKTVGTPREWIVLTPPLTLLCGLIHKSNGIPNEDTRIRGCSCIRMKASPMIDNELRTSVKISANKISMVIGNGFAVTCY